MTMAGVALITGAGTGIGQAAATALASAGWKLALVGRRAGPLEETAALVAPAEALVLPADVTREDAVDDAVARTVARWGRLDLLFNNAGMGARPVDIDTLTVAEWREVVEVNLTGSFLCARAAFRQMKAQTPRGGRIINNGSIAAHAPRPFSAPYTATKHAITGLTRSLSLDGRAHNIAVGQIDVGNAATAMARPMQAGILQPHGGVMVEPTMDPDDVGRAVLHMASLPLSANVLFMTIMATAMPYVGRG